MPPRRDWRGFFGTPSRPDRATLFPGMLVRAERAQRNRARVRERRLQCGDRIVRLSLPQSDNRPRHRYVGVIDSVLSGWRLRAPLRGPPHVEVARHGERERRIFAVFETGQFAGEFARVLFQAKIGQRLDVSHQEKSRLPPRESGPCSERSRNRLLE